MITTGMMTGRENNDTATTGVVGWGWEGYYCWRVLVNGVFKVTLVLSASTHGFSHSSC